jgi:rhodanese-related sulfurtransferase
LIQATDHWIAVRNARIVLIDGGERVRAVMAASWLGQLGCDAFVLEDGVRARLKGPVAAEPVLPRLPAISPVELKRALEAGTCIALDLGPSMGFRKAHIPGSRWSIRSRLANVVREAKTIVLVAADGALARLAATELFESGVRDMKLLDGGMAAWTRAGLPTEATPADPPDAECIDYLFFVHDRHGGNREAMRQYLAWETGLIAQLDEQERATFRIGEAGS